ncbi:MAG: 3',5'-cyclic-nucleotide phosphodiesterase [Syntrophorhabdales bacterium]|jgi:cAMP phosphodiesterase
MKIEVLGCYGNVTRRCRSTAFLINDHVLFDAGTVTEVLPADRLKGISHVLLSHIHMDHVKGLCSLAEDFSMPEDKRVTVVAAERVIDALSKHVFNNCLWPDFTAIPDKERGIVQLQIADPLGYTAIGNLSVKPIPVHHRIFTTGFVVKESDTTVMLTSDTGMTEQFWQEAKRESHVAFIIAHVAFPSRLSHLALTAGHMTLAMLLERIDTYGLHHLPCYISHMKSMFAREIRHEIQRAGRENLRVLKQGSVLVA